jgi:peptidoglycan hydrolase-like protein with peptidoglycan-binding domain
MSPYLQTARQLKDEIDRAQREGIVEACLAAEAKAGLPRGLLLAVASRETHCRNVAGDGGHGRGVFQIDDRFHGDWLRRHGAGRPGAVPSVEDGAEYAAQLLSANLAYGRSKGLSGRRLLKFAAAAYNAGAGGAWKALQLTGDPDSGTANRNYGADVLDRHRLLERWIDAGDGGPQAPPPTLRLGDVGPSVLELKRKLRAWFVEYEPAGAPEFRMNTSFGPALVTAVEVFQRVNRLEADGVCGPDTWAVLDQALTLQ